MSLQKSRSTPRIIDKFYKLPSNSITLHQMEQYPLENFYTFAKIQQSTQQTQQQDLISMQELKQIVRLLQNQKSSVISALSYTQFEQSIKLIAMACYSTNSDLSEKLGLMFKHINPKLKAQYNLGFEIDVLSDQENGENGLLLQSQKIGSQIQEKGIIQMLAKQVLSPKTQNRKRSANFSVSRSGSRKRNSSVNALSISRNSLKRFKSPNGLEFITKKLVPMNISPQYNKHTIKSSSTSNLNRRQKSIKINEFFKKPFRKPMSSDEIADNSPSSQHNKHSRIHSAGLTVFEMETELKGILNQNQHSCIQEGQQDVIINANSIVPQIKSLQNLLQSFQNRNKEILQKPVRKRPIVATSSSTY